MAHKGVWTIAEENKGVLKTVSFELLTRGRKLADALNCELVSVLFTGSQISDDQLTQLIRKGADRLIVIEDKRLKDFIPLTYSNVLSRLIDEKKPEIILAAATANGRTLMPHVATKIHTGLTADCTELSIEAETGNLLQTRPAIGGNIMATIKTPLHRPQMATVRPKSSKPLDEDLSREGIIERIPLNSSLIDERVRKIGFIPNDEEDANIQEADVVVAGGRGMKKANNFYLLSDLAKIWKGQVGGSRDAVDRGWVKYPHQIGLSGKTVTPKLYFAIGVSGSVQHLAGMKTSETIIAINSDADAAIFNVSDFGITGDLFEILPILNQRLKEHKQEKEV